MQFPRQRPVPRRVDGRHPGDTRQPAGQPSTAEAGQADDGDERSEPGDRARGLRQFGILTVVVGVLLSVIYSLQSWNLSDIASDVAVAIAVSGASLFLGLLVGFLFGIPRPLSSPDAGLIAAERSETEPAKESNGRTDSLPVYEQNTNREIETIIRRRGLEL